MTQMTWAEAIVAARAIDCRHATPVALESLPSGKPPDDCAAMVLCEEKVRLGITPDDCCHGRCPCLQ